ncbi:hypothetical protein DDO73_15120 [Vibrio cholerae]|nr:hypothetical protein [Vibrio cholerae]HAU9839352.1 hypothetical protein [Vibrio cholerae O1]
MPRLNQFSQGVIYAAAILVNYHNDCQTAADVLEQAGLLNSDCSSLDDYEKQAMRKLQCEDNRCNFKGLT